MSEIRAGTTTTTALTQSADTSGNMNVVATNNITNTDIIITTSNFHKERAEKIFNGIFQNNVIPKWNLSNKECHSCWIDEKKHMLNIDNDIRAVLLI